MKKIKDILGQEIQVGDRVAMAQHTEGSRWQSIGIVEEISTLRKDGKLRKQPLVKIKIHKHGKGRYWNCKTTLEPSKCLVKITHCEKCGKPWRSNFGSTLEHVCS